MERRSSVGKSLQPLSTATTTSADPNSNVQFERHVSRSSTTLFLHPDQAPELEEVAKKLLENHCYVYNVSSSEDAPATTSTTPPCEADDVTDDTKNFVSGSSSLSVTSASSLASKPGPPTKWWSQTFTSFVRRNF